MNSPRKTCVLFLCTQNSCRSQIAEGFLRHMAGNRFEATSAGTHPAGLNPLAVETMNEIGIDISGQRSKSVDELHSVDFDFVITVCDRARASCPVFPSSVSTLHWNIADPAEVQGTAEVRKLAFGRVREEIAGLIRNFITAVSG